MMKFIRGRAAHVNTERLKLQKELFKFNKTIFHGFPHRPSALAFDSSLSLIAIGSNTGVIRVYGRPGVEFQATHPQSLRVVELLFIENAGQIVSLLDDGSIHLWEIQLPNEEQTEEIPSNELILVKSCYAFENDTAETSQSENVPKDTPIDSNRITVLQHVPAAEAILVGNASGKVYTLSTRTFTVITASTIIIDTSLASIASRKISNVGEVRGMSVQPEHPHRVLIAYFRGLIVLWNVKTAKVDSVFVSAQTLESVDWFACGKRFISSASEGSYQLWSIDDEIDPSEQRNSVYGPFPCKPINKVYGNYSSEDDHFIVFSGGMPRREHSDRHTVSVIKKVKDLQKHQAFDFTSKVIDFVVVEQNVNGQSIAQALIVLAEEELVAIDLTNSDWLPYKMPYLNSVHLSPITCCQVYSGIPNTLIENLKKAAVFHPEGVFSTNEWPLTGGVLKPRAFASNNEVLITGHEDGSVRLWDVSDVCMTHLYTLRTSKLFFSPNDDIAPIDGDDLPEESEEEWPPFRKVGVFDPFSDDPRLGVRKVVLCPKSETLVVAGTAGQVIIYELKTQLETTELFFENMNLVADIDGFVWKSHDKLDIRTGSLHEPDIGFQPRSLLQISPPASITALALQSEWGLIAVGTGHGFGTYDYLSNRVVYFKCTLNPADTANSDAGEGIISRRKSFKKSLRESFRRLRRGKSQRQTKAGVPPKPVVGNRATRVASGSDINDFKPVERQIEAKSEDGLGSIVRYLFFAKVPLYAGRPSERSLWAGANSGRVFIHTLNMPEDFGLTKPAPIAEQESTNAAASPVSEESSEINEKENVEVTSSTEKSVEESKPVEVKERVYCVLVKEIQLKHHAPVIFIHTLDSHGHPSTDIEESTDKNAVPKVLICSEEQFKLFNLPTLKPFGKFKLTAHEGSKARRIQITQFISKSDSTHKEFCLSSFCNQGDVGIYSLLELKRQLHANVTDADDISGYLSLAAADNGDGVYLHSPSEFSRFSLAASREVKPACMLEVSKLTGRLVIEEPKAEDKKASEDESAKQVEEKIVKQIENSEPKEQEQKEKNENVKEEIEETEKHEEFLDAEEVHHEENIPVETTPIETQIIEEVKTTINNTEIQSETINGIAQTVIENLEQAEETGISETDVILQRSFVLSNEDISDSEMLEDSRADEDTVIDHLDINNGLNALTIVDIKKEPQSPDIIKSNVQNGKLQNGDKNGDGEEVDSAEEDKGIEVLDDHPNRFTTAAC